mgnify:CR=1 FL=1
MAKVTMIRRLSFFAVLLFTEATLADTIGVIGASGNIGSAVVDEALSRGHTVVGISRTPEKLSNDNEQFSAVYGDVTNIDAILKLVGDTDIDTLVVSVQGGSANNKPGDTAHARASRVLIEAADKVGAGFPRVIQVGGFLTLQNSVVAMKDTVKQMPFEAPPGSPLHAMLFGHWQALQNYRNSHINWTVATPPASIAPGPRTGTFRLSTEQILRDDSGKSAISIADFAAAIVDEIEEPEFLGKRFTVAY